MQNCTMKNNKSLVQTLSEDERVEVLEYVNAMIHTMQEYEEIPSTLEIVSVSLFGSRITGGCADESDLDVKIEYRNLGDAYHKESYVFNLFAGEELNYNGIKLDFFPILID